MKKSYLLFFTLASTICLLSNSGGYSLPATGAPGNTASCSQSGCHSAGNFNPSVSIQLMDTDGNEVPDFIGGEAYTVTVLVESPATIQPSGYGFQLVCLDDSEDPINAFGDLPDGVRTFMNGGRRYLVQSQRLPVGRISIPWTAPADVGAVTFYAGAAAVNGNGTSAQDGGAEGSATFSRNTSAVTAGTRDDLFQVHPNPTVDYVTVVSDEDLEIEVLNITGQTLTSQTEKVIDLTQYAAGSFIIKATDVEGLSQSIMVVKK